MSKQTLETVRLDKIVGGGQAIGTLADGRKAFVWGGLPGELVEIQPGASPRDPGAVPRTPRRPR